MKLLPGPVAAATKLAFANESEDRQANERLAIIRPLLDLDVMLPAQTDHQLTLPELAQPISKTKMIALLSAKHGVSGTTLWKWYSAYKSGGIFALADNTRKDKGKSRFFAEHPQAATLAAYLYLEQRQSFRSAYEAICRDCLQLALKPDELPSYETVRAFLSGSEFSEPMKILARDGQRAYREACAPYVSRGYTDVAANEIWVSDHMIHDVEVQNDCFDDAPLGTPIRLRFTCLLDFRARMVVGVSWAWEGSSRSIATALRRAVMAHGPAELMYCDNGKDYLKVAKGAAPASAESDQQPGRVVCQRELPDRGPRRVGAAEDGGAALHRPPSPVEARRAFLPHPARALR